jgi:hypothetical protein
LESATHTISHSGGEPPLPWPEPKINNRSLV